MSIDLGFYSLILCFIISPIILSLDLSFKVEAIIFFFLVNLEFCPLNSLPQKQNKIKTNKQTKNHKTLSTSMRPASCHTVPCFHISPVDLKNIYNVKVENYVLFGKNF